MTPIYVSGRAAISEDGVYRYSLCRMWGVGERVALFVMLNPSTADESLDDPTIRRCVGFAQREDCHGLVVVNLYAFRATNPDDLWTAEDPIGPENDRHIQHHLDHAVGTNSPIIAAWGAHARPHRVYKVKSMPGMEYAQCLARTKSGAPGHPLYIKGDAPLLPLTPHAPPIDPGIDETARDHDADALADLGDNGDLDQYDRSAQ